MQQDKIQTPHGTFVVNQGVRDIQEGLRQGDLSRVSVYGGVGGNQGGHFGNNSPNVGRGGQPFGGSK